MYSESQLLNEVNSYISNFHIGRKPVSLYEPVNYILSLGGKRIRPLLLLMAYNLYKENIEDVMPQAMALEVHHNFTLLHDDLMDNADMRRNKPTVHKVWDENTAILSGDAMMIFSYHLLSENQSDSKLKTILELFNNMSLEICEGQQYDLEFEKRSDVTEMEYLEMIRLKTAVLLATALKIGAKLANASEKDAQYLYDFGIQVGVAFQLKDDFLDVYGDSNVFGKNIGGDILCNKKTYMLIKALERADKDQKKTLNDWISKTEYDPKEKIEAVTNIYNQVGIKSICENEMNAHYKRGMDNLSKVEISEENKLVIKGFAERLMYREL